eukprot:766910-Hanusia_phi.AAC.2
MTRTVSATREEHKGEKNIKRQRYSTLTQQMLSYHPIPGNPVTHCHPAAPQKTAGLAASGGAAGTHAGTVAGPPSASRAPAPASGPRGTGGTELGRPDSVS